MSLRRTAPLSVALLTALALATARPSPLQAAGVATFRLTNIDPVGAAPVSSVLARIKPPSTVVPRDVENDPPTILPETTGFVSSGFEPDDLEVSLVDGSTDLGDPFQILKLDFGANGFGPGGRLYFQLNKAEDFEGDVELILPESVTNLAIEALEHLNGIPRDNDGDNTPPPTTPEGPSAQVPEPSSVLLWSTLALTATWLRLRRGRPRPIQAAA